MKGAQSPRRRLGGSAARCVTVTQVATSSQSAVSQRPPTGLEYRWLLGIDMRVGGGTEGAIEGHHCTMALKADIGSLNVGLYELLGRQSPTADGGRCTTQLTAGTSKATKTPAEQILGT